MEVLGRLLDVVFPPACCSCKVSGFRFLCPPCEAALPSIDAACERCGRPAARALSECLDCRALRPAFLRARAPFVYAGPARDALMTFKLGGERRAARPMAVAMARAALRAGQTATRTEPSAARAGSPDGVGRDTPAADVVTFVPATRRALAARGFNPAKELARHVAVALGLPCWTLLRKVRETEDQAGLSRAARRRNLAGAFASPAASGTILLVDDVLTTGATADACARALLAAGATEVAILTFARAV